MSEFPKSYPRLLITFHLPRKQQGYEVIGNDEGTEFRRMPDGGIFSVDNHGVLPIRFVNSSLRQFCQCIDAHEKYSVNVCDSVQEELQLEAVEQLASAVHNLDTKALCDPTNWWSVIIEQMRDGML